LCFILIGFVWIIRDILDYYRFSLVLNQDGVMVKKGILLTNSKQVPYKNINIVAISQGIFGKIFNFGDIEISTGGDGTDLVFRHVANPEEIKKKIQTAMG
jgi:uncharacterized membrane protein YdbT with pleckstrin-like domain